MCKYLFLALLSSSAFGSSFSIGVGLGYSRFDDLSVPYAIGSYRGLDPRADGGTSRSDVTRRQGLELKASLSSREQVFETISLKNELFVEQISGISGMEAEDFTNASLNKIGVKSVGNFTLDLWPLTDVKAGFSLQRKEWRNVSTAHLLDTISVIGGLELGRIQYVQLAIEGQRSLRGRFAWDDEVFNLTPKTMKNINLSDSQIEAKLNYLRIKNLSFHLIASEQLTKIKFNHLQENYAQSGLEVNPFLPSVQTRSLKTLSYSFGFDRRF